MSVKNISIHDYSYELPADRIALHPLPERDQSKLLVWKNDDLEERQFNQISQFIPEESLMVFNNTKVIHARLAFQRETGAHIEILCLEPINVPDVSVALSSKGTSMWKAFVGNAKKWKDGERLTMMIPYPEGEIKLTAMLLNRNEDLFVIGLFWEPFALTLSEVLHYAGTLPLPPYLNRENIPEDEERYQTVYAQHNGSVAAPTAGLHFTFETLDQLASRNISICDVTLHVGAGTFKPVKAAQLGDHLMHQEQVTISLETLHLIRDQLKKNKPITAVGTTVTRTLESIYWHGVKGLTGVDTSIFNINQWDPYELNHEGITPLSALQFVIDEMNHRQLKQLTGYTALIIAPGYSFKYVDILVTNFHQPESSLLLLIAAFAGEKWRSIYDYALTHQFRFLSYGDSSILFRSTST